MNHKQELADAKRAMNKLILTLPYGTSTEFLDAIHRERMAQLMLRTQEVKRAMQETAEIWNPKARETA